MNVTIIVVRPMNSASAKPMKKNGISLGLFRYWSSIAIPSAGMRPPTMPKPSTIHCGKVWNHSPNGAP